MNENELSKLAHTHQQHSNKTNNNKKANNSYQISNGLLNIAAQTIISPATSQRGKKDKIKKRHQSTCVQSSKYIFNNDDDENDQDYDDDNNDEGDDDDDDDDDDECDDDDDDIDDDSGYKNGVNIITPNMKLYDSLSSTATNDLFLKICSTNNNNNISNSDNNKNRYDNKLQENFNLEDGDMDKIFTTYLEKTDQNKCKCVIQF
jgi:hypothetical protein